MKCKQCGTETDSKFCPNCGSKAEEVADTIIMDTKQKSQNENKKETKPFYKKWWFIVIAIIVVVGILGNIDLSFEKVDWQTLQLSSNIPEPEKGKVSVGSDLEDYLGVRFENVDKEFFNEYVDACVGMGYNIESKKIGDSYEAFNDEGYELYITYFNSSEEISIILKAPTNMSTLEWPTKGIGAILPQTKSTLGKVVYDTSDNFQVIVGNTTREEYNNYVEACENKGFTVDYSKQEDYYSAQDKNGYRLNIRYIGANRIEVSIQEPKKETTTTITSNTTTSVESEKTTTTTTTKKETTTSGMSKEFKQAMDSYEAAMNEYIAFMKKYKKSNGTDMSLLSDYSKYMTKYAEACEAFAKWEDEDLNATESAYYLKVQTRINKKLLEVAY